MCLFVLRFLRVADNILARNLGVTTLADCPGSRVSDPSIARTEETHFPAADGRCSGLQLPLDGAV